MIFNILKDLVLSNVGKLKPSSKGWQSRNCMLCTARGHSRDTRGRFGIKFENNGITCNCFNCGYSAHWDEGADLSPSFKFLLKNIGADDMLIKSLEFEIYKQRHSLESPATATHKESKIRNLLNKWPKKSLPNDTLPITTWLESGCTDPDLLQVAEYAISRKITMLDDFYWCPDKNHQLNKRLIIPYYYKQTIVGFTARYSIDSNDKSIPKYFQICPPDFVYNIDAQEKWQRKYVIVTEGVLDAWVVDGVGTLGEINQEKVDIIRRLQKDVIVCPDRDKSGKHLVDAAIANGWAVSFPRWHASIKDAAKAVERYGRLLTVQSIVASATQSKEKIQLQWDIEESERNRRKK